MKKLKSKKVAPKKTTKKNPHATIEQIKREEKAKIKPELDRMKREAEDLKRSNEEESLDFKLPKREKAKHAAGDAAAEQMQTDRVQEELPLDAKRKKKSMRSIHAIALTHIYIGSKNASNPTRTKMKTPLYIVFIQNSRDYNLNPVARLALEFPDDPKTGTVIDKLNEASEHLFFELVPHPNSPDIELWD